MGQTPSESEVYLYGGAAAPPSLDMDISPEGSPSPHAPMNIYPQGDASPKLCLVKYKQFPS